MTLNDHWGYCRYDDNWKSAGTVIGDAFQGRKPERQPSIEYRTKGRWFNSQGTVGILDQLGDWMKINGNVF